MARPALPTKSKPGAAAVVHPFDAAHGVETGGLVPAGALLTGHSSDRHITAYYGVAPSILRQMVALWRETAPAHPIPRYSFVDIGAGKGRAILVASELGFRRVLGVELNPVMADQAQSNIDLWIASHASDSTAPAIAPIRLMEQDALEFDLPDGPCLIFLFHPFEAPLMKRFLRRIEAQAATPSRSQLRGAANQTASAAYSIATNAAASTAVGGANSTTVGAASATASKAGQPTSKANPPTSKANPPTSRKGEIDLLYVNAECAAVFAANPAFEQLWFGRVAMSPEDHAADRAAIAEQREYGSTGDEECAIYRYIGRATTA